MWKKVVKPNLRYHLSISCRDWEQPRRPISRFADVPVDSRRMKITTHLNTVPRLRRRGACFHSVMRIPGAKFNHRDKLKFYFYNNNYCQHFILFIQFTGFDPPVRCNSHYFRRLVPWKRINALPDLLYRATERQKHTCQLLKCQANALLGLQTIVISIVFLSSNNEYCIRKLRYFTTPSLRSFQPIRRYGP
jgi:hypothetical protein